MTREIDPDLNKQRRWVMIVYVLQVIGFFIGLSFIPGIIINYIKRDEVYGTFLESHHRWQMNTFWFGLLWTVVGVITMTIVIGAFILIANTIWVIYRVIKGIIKLSDNVSVKPYKRRRS